MASNRNLFSLGRRASDEDQLTEMLVWLAEAVPAVSLALVRLALGESDSEPADVVVSTQHGIAGGRLDAYLTGDDFALVVESKLGSSYGESQLRKYLAWLSSEAVAQERRALMTLTADEAPWPDSDLAFATDRNITASARRWEELHASLEPIATAAEGDVLAARLVHEFLEMLGEEGLIPMKPLAAVEMEGVWADAWAVVARYRDFFRSCRRPMEEALGATASSSSRSERGDWFWQDFVWDDGLRLAVGLLNTDRYERLPRGAHTGSPIMWLAPKAEHLTDWRAIAASLDRLPPDGWYPGNRWYERPTCWQYLAHVVGTGSFEEQRDRLAASARVGRDWVREAVEQAVATQVPGGE